MKKFLKVILSCSLVFAILCVFGIIPLGQPNSASLTVKRTQYYIIEPVTYDLSISGSNATVIVTCDGQNINSGSGVLLKNSVVTVTATADTGYVFSSFQINGEDFESGNTYTVNGDVLITYTTVLETYDLIITGTNGTVTVTKNNENIIAGLNVLTYGDVITITLSANNGYALTEALVNNEAFTSGNTITVIGDVSISYTTGQVASSTFGNNSPAIISAISDIIASQGMTSAEVASTYGWNLGDTVDITLTNNETIQMRIIGINHDTLSSDHTTKAGITLHMVDCLATLYPMNDTITNAGGWEASKMRVTTLPTIFALLPDEWQAVIKMVDKKSANGGSSNYSAIVTTSDNLFLLSEKEVFGSITYAQNGNDEGTQYEYWVGKTANDRIKYYNDVGTQTATLWGERSSSNTSTSSFCSVKTGGVAGLLLADLSRGLAFGCCV